MSQPRRMSLPQRLSYSGLAGNERRFQSGFPVLTYHKVARRPRAAKWRSLYLSPELFARQMRELAEAGYTTARLSDPRPESGNPSKKFAITFDDGYANVATNAAVVLAAHRFKAIQFIVAGHLGGTNAWDVAEGEVAEPLMDAYQIVDWLAAGHEIGSHTLSHPRLTQLAPARLREEIGASKRRLEDLFSLPVRHFCYPYGDYNPLVLAEVARAGYETACTHLETAVSTASTPRLELRRIEARYPKRNLKRLVTAMVRWFRPA